ncbi:unnamed protein product [Auanema sp. JU1783]|nr:unnamed protein product [Auanema sp. JU1783]
MNTFVIPGFEPEPSEDNDEDQKVAEKYYLAIDNNMSVVLSSIPLAIVPEKHNPTFTFIQQITEEEHSALGNEILEEKVDFDEDNYIHCDICDRFFRGACKDHPLFLVSDRSPKDKHKSVAPQTSPSFVKINPSKIPNAGLGVFATSAIPRGIVFGPYKGRLIKDPKDATSDGYCWELTTKTQHCYIDGSDENCSNWMRYINHSMHEAEQNVIAFQYLGCVYYRVFRPIEKEEEILVYYGESFANALLTGQGGVCSIRKPKKKAKLTKNNPFIRM